jgi:Mg2+-importing ATPase
MTEGLSSAEAARRFAAEGPNDLARTQRRPVVLEFLLRFRNPLVLVLLISGAVSMALGERRSAAVVAVIVMISVTLDFVQEHRAMHAAEMLRRSVESRATVRRDGRELAVPAREVVRDDLVLLHAGDRVPADAHVIEAHDLFVDQAMLTGESYPVEKRAGEGGDPLDPSNETQVFLGTSVVSGMGVVRVARIGATTELGHAAQLVGQKPPASDFERGTRELGLLIARLTAMLVAFVVTVNVALHRPVFESLLFAVALAVGLTPELLPMIVSVTLARGALRLARKRVIVKRLPAIQNLGCMDILLSDKTGTLTEAKVTLAKHVDLEGNDSRRVLELAYVNSAFESGLKSPLDEAILAAEPMALTGMRKVDEVPFDFERRRVSVLVDDGAERTLVVKGALEDMLRISSRFQSGSTVRSLDEVERARLAETADRLCKQGFRIIAVGARTVERERSHASVADERELVLHGLCAFFDPPKETAREAVQALARRGVAVKIVTGDDPRVALHVCETLSMETLGVLTGKEIGALTDDALAVRAESTTLFCRMTPAQKMRVLMALRRRHVVGFLGDGINDAPSLRAADVGISIDTAVDVAKEAADLVLLEHDLRVVHDGVIEGRRTFGNVSKYVMMGTSSNFGNMVSMAAASALLPFLPMLPLQILLNNLLYDISEIAIPLDDVDEATLARPHRFDVSFVRRFMLTMGPVSSAFDLLTFAALLLALHASAEVFRTGWFIESLASQVLVIFVIRTRGSAFSSRPSKWLTILAASVLSIAVALTTSPWARTLGFTTLPLPFYAILGGLLVTYLASAELVKRRFYRGLPA